MPNIKPFIVTLATILSSSSLLAATYTYEGVNEQGDACSIMIETDNQGELRSLDIFGHMVVNYHIPAPFSGLYGKYYMEQTQSFLDEGKQGKYLTTEPLKLERGKFTNKLFVTTQMAANPESGDPDFNVTFYKMKLDSDFEDLKSYKYESRVKLKKIIPFVSTDMKCLDLIRQ